ncbi:DUF4350 domain-containing protein [Puerhibacterium puerhi]|uniref:DUF4350 domain-containing protein n=1 Tax=Puerhibacterium puerhi TaxID=2692623 RepID=UPI0013594C2F|nr:DUF4350 domain-containing protein [Puerhibacterium puerhi]
MTALGTPPPVTAPARGATVVGDGTTAAGRAARRWRAVRWWVVVLAAVALVVAVLAVTRPATSTTPYAPDNARPDGARAVARVLEDRGVDVRHVTTVDDAVQAATEGATLLVAPSPLLSAEQVDALAGVPADLVLLGADDLLLEAATDGAVRLGDTLDTSAGTLAPDCALPAARAAGDVRLTASLAAAPGAPDVVTCYPGSDGAALAAVADGGRTVTAVDDPSLVLNGTVLEAGNAALALHLLGAHERLVWLVPDPFDLSTGDGTGGAAPAGPTLPRWTGAVGLWAGLVVLVLAFWRGRRLGPLVAEELPVVVPAAEAARGRGRLYRRARARGHAAAGLRAAAATRIAARLGLPRSADPTGVVDAVVRASGRDPRDVAALLYGPPPPDDEALAELARRLDALDGDTAGRAGAARPTPGRPTPGRHTPGSEVPRS